jgi:hypothetical protein
MVKLFFEGMVLLIFCLLKLISKIVGNESVKKLQ